MHASLLHVVTVISNTRRYQSRYRLAKDFFQHMNQSGVNLHVVECAFGARPFELEGAIPFGANYYRVRTPHELWLKENLINIGVSKLPDDWQYVAWIDADIRFVRPDWAEETVHMLQHHPVIQPYSTVQDFGPNYEALRTHPDSCNHAWHGFGYSYRTARKLPSWRRYGYDKFWHPGFAWAATKEAWNTFGGLPDRAILGSADHHMALALLGAVERSYPSNISKAYKNYMLTWQEHAKPIRHELGYVKGGIDHYWHGDRTARRYKERWSILIDTKYDPYTDVKYDSQGVLQLAGNKPELKREIQYYFEQRNEDSIDVRDGMVV
jgi:glycosyltransferase involved in cell wall biosynthesis